MRRCSCDAYGHWWHFIPLEYESVLFNGCGKHITFLDYYLHGNGYRCCGLYRYQFIYCHGKYTLNAAVDGI